MIKLGKKKRVGLKTVFKSEPGHFTPWLEEHIDELAESIHVDIIDVKRESGVGSFNCDLIGTEANSKDKIIIENQFDQTDHKHLGQIIAYASGVDAKYVVWIAETIRDEHQKALEWLNENVGEISFFGVEISLVTVDDSIPAPDFKLVVQPNAWSKEVKRATEQVDERHQKYRQFYTRLVAEYEKIKPEWSHLTPQPYSWLAFGAGKTGFSFMWAFRGNNRFDVELYIDTKDRDEVKSYFTELRQYEDEINIKIPGLEWEELPDSRGSRIAIYKQMPTSIKNLLSSDESTNELIHWAIEQMDAFRKHFPDYISKL